MSTMLPLALGLSQLKTLPHLLLLLQAAMLSLDMKGTSVQSNQSLYLVGDERSEFNEYLRYGGSPRSLEYDDSKAKAHYIEDVV